MKKIFIILLIMSAFASCDSPLHITGNPDKSTAGSGGAGSGKMSEELPGKAGTRGLSVDTNKVGGPIVIDTAKVKRDTLPH
jgi:hypothetical protein